MVLSRCCFCFSLRSGSLKIGSLNLVLSVAALVFYLKTSKNIGVIYGSKNPGICPTRSNLSPEVITYLTCLIILSVTLITGAAAKNSKILIVYLCGGFINFGFVTYICAIFLIKAIIPTEESSKDRWLEFFIPVIVPVIYAYYWLVVFSYYRELTKKTNNGVVIHIIEDQKETR